jgi:hypothetical protein
MYKKPYHACSNDATRRLYQLNICNDSPSDEDVVENTIDSKVFGHHIAKQKQTLIR